MATPRRGIRAATRLAVGGLLGLIAASVAVAPAVARTEGARPPAVDPGTAVTRDLMVTVRSEPDGKSVRLDATIYRPAQSPSPLGYPGVLLAHGFGGSKADLVAQAEELAGRGYVALAYTARGFGDSGGRIHLDDPDYEVADAQALLDVLAAEPGIATSRDGDPLLGVMGASYGGALALMAAGTDRRVDAVVAAITWNDLASAFFPQAALRPGGDQSTPAGGAAIATPGPFKQLWASRFFGAALAGARSSAGAGSTPGSDAATQDTAPLTCGRFDPTVCRRFLAAAETGEPSEALLELLRAHSPAPYLKNLHAPTLLIQGQSDSLFGLEQADATARALHSWGTPVAVRWTDGGHDAQSTTAEADAAAAQDWFDTFLSTATATDRPAGVGGFTWSGPIPRRNAPTPQWAAPTYPGFAPVQTLGTERLAVVPQPKPQTVLTPPGGQPASVTTVPGLGGLVGGSAATSAATYPLAALPGQFAAFDTVAAPHRIQVVGSPRVTLSVRSTGAVVTLFASWWQVSGGSATMPRRLVAPVSVPVTPGVPTSVELALPAGVYTIEPGSTWRVLITSTDSSYAPVRSARIDQVSLFGDALILPTAPQGRLTTQAERDTETVGVLAASAGLAIAAVVAWLWRRRRVRANPPRPDLADIPLVVTDLVKTYWDGHRAVDDVSWRAERGQVVGLLGPNGAGKTTTLRMVMGLIHPDSGTVHVLGEPVHPGSAVLGRVGALIEGPGFLPHLTGRQNLAAFWSATGRPADEAYVDQALEVAALGDAVDRPVRSYSHGMKQRLGIAQAMLGRPDVLVLDEPTNGLDPPQIAAMRPILQAYAATGRTVVVSSHLLAEVEMTCSHVVVMNAGRVVAAGAMADLVGSDDTSLLDLRPGPASRPGTVAAALRARPGIHEVSVSGDRLTVTADVDRATVVRLAVQCGADLVGVSGRRPLEEVFLGIVADAGRQVRPR
jgi:ABC-2 type transport system ATP-binding protein